VSFPPHTAFLNVGTFELKTTNLVIVKETKFAVDVLRANATPAVPSTPLAAVDYVPHAFGDEVTAFTERLRRMPETVVPNPPTQIAIHVLHLLFHTQRYRVMDKCPYFLPKPLLTPFIGRYQNKTCSCLPALGIVELKSKKVHALPFSQSQLSCLLGIQSSMR